MKTTTGPQCQKYFATGHACPGCEQCAPLPVQAPPVKGAFLNLQGGVTLCQNGAEERSFGFASRLYAAHAQAQPVAGDERALIGRLLDEMSQLQILWGLNEPGGLLRFSDVSNVLFAAGKLAATQPAAASDKVTPNEEWEAYARKSGLLNKNGIAPDPAKTQTAYFAFTAAWNRSYEYNLAANKPAAPAAEQDQRSLQIIAGCATDDLSDIRAELGLSDDDCIDAVLETIRVLKAPASAAQPVAIMRDGPEGAWAELTDLGESLPEGTPCFASPVAAAVPEVSAAARDVLAERQRQISVEGWSVKLDDKYIDCELARAAATYALCTKPGQLKVCDAPVWPWPMHWWKPTTYRRNLVKAAALLLAEIERADRASVCSAGPAAPTTKED